jgi:hypothetical protein
MDYLHGDLADGECQAACLYEYARESRVLRLTARKPNKLHRITEKHYWIVGDSWCSFWSCPSFPRKPWNQVPKSQRTDMPAASAARGVPPLHMIHLGTLDAMGVFDRLDAMAKAGPNQDPILELPNCFTGTLALFNLDFTQCKEQMLRRFAAWLDLPENERRFQTPGHNRRGRRRTESFKDRLKDLAVWRLYDKLGFDGMQDFAEGHRKHSRDGRPRPFHDARQGQREKQPLNQAPLCSEESVALKAKARARAYLAELIPWEFGAYAAEEERFLNEWIEALRPDRPDL